MYGCVCLALEWPWPGPSGDIRSHAPYVSWKGFCSAWLLAEGEAFERNPGLIILWKFEHKVHLTLLLPKSVKQGVLWLYCLAWGVPWLSNNSETDTWQPMPQNISKVTSQDLPWGWCIQRPHTSDIPGNKSLYTGLVTCLGFTSISQLKCPAPQEQGETRIYGYDYPDW